MNDRLAQAFALLPNYLAQHILVSGAALLLGVALSLPLAVLASRFARIRWPILAAASLVQTIPGLALLALFYQDVKIQARRIGVGDFSRR